VFAKKTLAGGFFRWQESDEEKSIGRQSGNREGSENCRWTGDRVEPYALAPTFPNEPKSRIADRRGACFREQSDGLTRNGQRCQPKGLVTLVPFVIRNAGARRDAQVRKYPTYLSGILASNQVAP